MVFEGEDVPLEKDILKRTLGFVHSKISFSVEEQRNIFGLIQRSTSGSGTVASAGKNKVVFIYHITLSSVNTSVNINNMVLHIDSGDDVNAQTIMEIRVPKTVGSITISTPCFIKLEQGQRLRFAGGSTLPIAASCTVMGWEESKKII